MKQKFFFQGRKNLKRLSNKFIGEAEETLESILTRARGTILFKPPLNLCLDTSWMIGLTSLELYNFLFNTTKKLPNSRFIRIRLMSFRLKNLKKSLEYLLKVRIKHHLIYNMK